MDKKEILNLYRRTKLNIFPAGGKAPVSSWRKYQNISITETELEIILNSTDLKREIDGVGIICGGEKKIECIDIDNKGGIAEKILQKIKRLTTQELFEKLYIEKTPSGGYHIIYSCEKITGNSILARNKNNETIAETRGIGGFVVVAPTPGYTPIQGTLENLPHISPQERALLFSICSSFDAQFSLKTSIRPGDEFNQKAKIEDILIPLGWKKTGGNSFVEYWLRPGKSFAPSECSATWNPTLRKFYVFSTNVPELKDHQAYDLFGLYVHLYHHGDFQKAVKELVKQGYGTNGEEEKDIKPAKNKYQTVVDYLKSKGSFRYNCVRNIIEFKPKDSTVWEECSDRLIAIFWNELQQISCSASDNFIGNVIMGNLAEVYHPFKEYFFSLPPWDNFDYIGEFLENFDTEYPSYLDNLFRKWIVGVVARAIEMGRNDHCFTLVGPQGIGKTSIIRMLCPPQLKKYYAETSITIADKDSNILLFENFLINLDELETSQKMDEVGHLKALMTREEIKIRKPYARFHEVFPRRASFAASLNRMQFMNDLTGSRRFFVIPVKHIFFPDNFSPDGIYAQALHLLNSGFRYWLSSEEIEKVTEFNEQFLLPIPELELLPKLFGIAKVPEDLTPSQISALADIKGWILLSASEIFKKISEENKSIKLNIKSLGSSLQKLGAKQIFIRKDGINQRVYVLQRLDFPKTYPYINDENNNQKENIDDDPMPF